MPDIIGSEEDAQGRWILVVWCDCGAIHRWPFKGLKPGTRKVCPSCSDGIVFEGDDLDALQRAVDDFVD